MHSGLRLQKEQPGFSIGLRVEGGRRSCTDSGLPQLVPLKQLPPQMMDILSKSSGWTNIFIYPGYEFKAIDGMITNFSCQNRLWYVRQCVSRQRTCFKGLSSAVTERYRFSWRCNVHHLRFTLGRKKNLTAIRYELIKTCKQTGARLGRVHTPHGFILIPRHLCQLEHSHM